MKKRSLKLLACAAVLTMAFSLCACSPSDDKKDDDKKTEQSSGNSNSDTKKDNDDNSSTSDKEFATVEEYVNSPEVQSEISSLESQMSNDIMNVEVVATEDTMTYSFKYNDLEKADGMAEQLEQGVEAQKSVFQTTANSLKTLVDVENPKVVIEYLDKNGEMIYTTEFVAE